MIRNREVAIEHNAGCDLVVKCNNLHSIKCVFSPLFAGCGAGCGDAASMCSRSMLQKIRLCRTSVTPLIGSQICDITKCGAACVSDAEVPPHSEAAAYAVVPCCGTTLVFRPMLWFLASLRYQEHSYTYGGVNCLNGVIYHSY